MPEEHAAKPSVANCPHCGKIVSWDETSLWKPFCSERCRLIDLGGWLSGKHAIPGDAEPAPEEGAAN